MNIIIKKSTLKGKVSVISSKSHLHRALIAACFSDNKCRIFCNNNSDDISATVDMLKTLGAKINKTDNCIDVTPTDRCLLLGKIKSGHKFMFYCRQSASSLRFFIAISAILGLNSCFILEHSLRKRKIDSIYDFLTENKIDLTVDGEMISINGKIKADELIIDASLSSQFLSGILLGAAIVDKEIRIRESNGNKTVSKGYVLMTLRVLEDFAVKVICEKNCYIKPKNITYRNNFGEYHIESDFSNLGFFLALKLLSGKNNIIIENLPENSIQPDSIIVDIIKKMEIPSFKDKPSNKAVPIRPISFDIINNPDLLPVLAVFSAFANGISCFYNVDRLRIKESDRIFNIIKILNAFGVESNYRNNTLYIKGGIKKSLCLPTTYIDTDFDHRMIMLASTLSCLIDANVVIKDAGFVSKSDPLFFERLKALGADITYL